MVVSGEVYRGGSCWVQAFLWELFVSLLSVVVRPQIQKWDAGEMLFRFSTCMLPIHSVGLRRAQ